MELLQASIETGLIDADEDLSVGLDYGDEAIMAEIDFLDHGNQALVCSVWATADTVIDWREGPEYAEGE